VSHPSLSSNEESSSFQTPQTSINLPTELSATFTKSQIALPNQGSRLTKNIRIDQPGTLETQVLVVPETSYFTLATRNLSGLPLNCATFTPSSMESSSNHMLLPKLSKYSGPAPRQWSELFGTRISSPPKPMTIRRSQSLLIENSRKSLKDITREATLSFGIKPGVPLPSGGSSKRRVPSLLKTVPILPPLERNK